MVFDLGETLVDETRTWGQWADHLGVTRLTLFAALGACIAERRPHTDALRRFGVEVGPDGAVRRPPGMPDWVPGLGDLYPDALPVLGELRGLGHRLAVMGNQPLSAAPLLAELPVDRVATSAGWGVAKPDPAFFARVLDELEVPAERVAYVGDRVDNDVLPARRAGMLAVHLERGPWGLLQAGWPEAAEADLRLATLAELPGALSTWR